MKKENFTVDLFEIDKIIHKSISRDTIITDKEYTIEEFCNHKNFDVIITTSEGRIKVKDYNHYLEIYSKQK